MAKRASFLALSASHGNPTKISDHLGMVWDGYMVDCTHKNGDDLGMVYYWVYHSTNKFNSTNIGMNQKNTKPTIFNFFQELLSVQEVS